MPLTWIEQRLSESGLTIEQLVQSETQEQAGDQVSISNTIGSLRFLGSMDWREFVETMSVVEQKLREDPGGLYGRMDFATRDRYRHVVEEIAKGSPLSEGDVARKAIQLAHEGTAGAPAGSGDDDRAAHVGFYLVDKGRPRLERAAEMRRFPAEALRRAARRIRCCSTSARSRWSRRPHRGAAGEGPWRRGCRWRAGGARDPAAVGRQPARGGDGELAGDAARDAAPVAADGFPRGMPPQSRTLVVVPTMLTSAEGIEGLVEALEVRFLANRDDHLHFALLTDFTDAAAETLPEDEPLLRSRERASRT